MKEWLCNFIWNILDNKGCYLQKGNKTVGITLKLKDTTDC